MATDERGEGRGGDSEIGEAADELPRVGVVEEPLMAFPTDPRSMSSVEHPEYEMNANAARAIMGIREVAILDASGIRHACGRSHNVLQLRDVTVIAAT